MTGPNEIDQQDKGNLKELLRYLICEISPDLKQALTQTQLDYNICTKESELPSHKKVHCSFITFIVQWN